MQRFRLPKGDLCSEKGHWRIAGEEGWRYVAFNCPACGLDGLIGKVHPDGAHGTGHRIDPDGNVHPSVVCGHERCGFHEFVALDGWTADALR